MTRKYARTACAIVSDQAVNPATFELQMHVFERLTQQPSPRADLGVIITDSIELAGLPDGTYPGHSQIPHNQTKTGSRVTIESTETLIGGCAALDECVRNAMQWSGCGVAEAVRCVTENIADFMGEQSRGRLEIGRRADFVLLDNGANVLQTWIGGKKVWSKG